MFSRTGDERDLQCLEPGIGLVDGVAHPEAEIGRHLIVAGARGMKAAGRRANEFSQARLGGHVNVLEVPVLGNAAGLVLGRDLVQPVRNKHGILAGDDAHRAQHRDMRLAGGDVLPPQCLVEGDRGIYLAHDR